jgi:hypothetical protein
MGMTLFKVAKAAYNCMKEYGECINQPYMPEWGKSKELQDMAVDSITRMLKNYFDTYNTTGHRIIMSPETSHGLWRADASYRGWKLGPRFNLEKMINPRLRPFETIDKLQQGKSSVIVAIFREYLPLLEEEYWHLFQSEKERGIPGQPYFGTAHIRQLIINNGGYDD